MASLKSNILIKSLIMLQLLLCAFAIADNTDESKKVMTSLEQRMQKKISVDFIDTPIDYVLRIMSEQANVDIVKSPNVTGKVTATLTDVPLEEALINILASHNYGFVAGENMIRVLPREDITEKTERLVSRIYRISYADVKEVEKSLKKFISKKGSLSANVASSNIIVTDIESKVKAVDSFINEIDRVTTQILVEARIYDITNKDRLDLGVQWNAGRNTDFGADGVGDIGTNPSLRTDPFLSGIFDAATSKTSSSTGLVRIGWLNSAIDIDAMLKAQEENIDAKLLANPRVLVLDNETAEIKIISEIPYQEVTQSSEGGSIGSTEFREVGVELLVTPHIARDEMIRLHLRPEFSVKSEDVTVGVIGNTFTQPVVDRRTANTTLLVKSGQTVVLGGLRKKEVAKQLNKIPLLGDLPIAGFLFKFEGEDTVTSEIVVFVTPRIIENPALTVSEQQKFQTTEFNGPEDVFTRVEKDRGDK